MPDDDRRIRENTILLGDEADQFFKSELGKYILARSQQQVEDNLEAFKICDPTDTAKTSKLQFNINVAEAAIAWMAEALMAGREELEQMMNDEQ